MASQSSPKESCVATEVMTVLGPIPAEAIGVTLMHEHLIVDAVRLDAELILDDLELVIEEASRFRAAGGQTIVELSSRGLGRDPSALKTIARETGLQIVMGCAWYHERRYQPHLYRQTTNEIADEIIRDVTEGVDGTGIQSGIIGEVGCADHFVSPAEERVLRAAARAQLQTNLSISTHADFSPVGLAQLDIFEEEGVDPHRVIIGHCDSYPNGQFHTEVARRGAFVSFDLVREAPEWHTRRHIRWITSLITQGYLHHILLSHDVCKMRHLHAYGGFGYDYIPTKFVPLLKAAGISDEQVETLLIANPRTALTGARD